jgi:ATP-binding cassette, subfamily G (WHITE), member 2
MVVTGDIFLNGKPISKQTLKSMSGYVMQDDLIHSHLTVGETLSYTAALRMAKGTTRVQRKEREAEVMSLLGITYCKDIIVGDTRRKGISGGERKRLCIAMELLTKPSLLFLDEPTSGNPISRISLNN